MLGRAFRADPDLFRRLAESPLVVQLRERSRTVNELTRQRRLCHQIRQQLWRYYPQLLAIPDLLNQASNSGAGPKRPRAPPGSASPRSPNS